MVPKLSAAWWQQESHKHIHKGTRGPPHRKEDSVKSFCAMLPGDSPSVHSFIKSSLP